MKVILASTMASASSGIQDISVTALIHLSEDGIAAVVSILFICGICEPCAREP